jgi:small subunit ribosomal protein S20
MANIKSAEKRHRQNLERRERNRARTAVKKLRQAIDTGDAEQAQALLRPTLSEIDATAQKGVIHANTAARYKSRLSRAVAGLAS